VPGWYLSEAQDIQSDAARTIVNTSLRVHGARFELYTAVRDPRVVMITRKVAIMAGMFTQTSTELQDSRPLLPLASLMSEAHVTT
jgi:hypothetical protein